MNLLEMSLTGGVFILAVVVLRALALNRLPKGTFLALWAAAVLALSRGRERSPLFWAAACGAFGLSFGALCALPYLAGGPWAALSYWVAGIPFDLLHCGGNFCLTLALERPLYTLLAKLRDAAH